MYCHGADLLIQDCEIHHFTGFGIHPHRGSAVKPTGVRLIGNRIHTGVVTGEPSPGHVGLGLCNGVLAYDNLIYDIYPGNNENSVAIAAGVINAQVYFTTSVNCRRGMDLNGSSNPASNIVRNLLGYLNTSGEGFQNGTPTNSNNSFGVNPQFANLAGKDFHLTGGSPVNIRTGGVAVAGITTDLDGVAWANPPSMGCYQV